MAWMESRDGIRGKTYKVVWRDALNRRQSKTFGRYRDALSFKQTIEHDLEAGDFVNPNLGKEPLASFWDHYWRTSAPTSPNTKALYEGTFKRHIEPHLGSTRLNAFTKTTIKTFYADLREAGVGDSTLAVVHRLVHRVFAVAVEEDRLKRNPAEGCAPRRMAPRPEKVYLSAPELLSLTMAVPDRYRALVLFMGRTGVRIGEASALRLRNLHLDKGYAHITEAATEVRGERIVGQTKNRKERQVVVTPLLAKELEKHLERYTHGDPDELVFTAGNGGAIRQSNFRNRVFDKAAAIIGKPGLTPHSLRHTAVVLSIAAGAHPKQIQEMCGHSSIRVTLDEYGHLFESLQEELGAKVDALFQKLA